MTTLPSLTSASALTGTELFYTTQSNADRKATAAQLKQYALGGQHSRPPVLVEDFGAVGNGVTDDTAAIQAAFDFVAAAGRPLPIVFQAKKYKISASLTLPTTPQPCVQYLIGNGAEIESGTPNITFFQRVPTTQADSETKIDQCIYDIRGFTFTGQTWNMITGQTGLHLGGCYTPVVEHCNFRYLEDGLIGTFCLGGAWKNLRFQAITHVPFLLQTGAGYFGGAIWSGGGISTAASNINTVENCRVYGDGAQFASFVIAGSDAVVIRRCISEGSGAASDVFFDSQLSGTVKNFDIDGFHCEAPNAKVNFRVRTAGRCNIHGVVRSYPAIFLDASGSLYPSFKITGVAYWGNMPSVKSDPTQNPNGRWFLHSDGGGYGGVEGGTSGGGSWEFDIGADGSANFTNPGLWEAGNLPSVLIVRTFVARPGGVELYSTDTLNVTTPSAKFSGSVQAVQLVLTNLPTSDPGVPGQVWDNSGTLMISAPAVPVPGQNLFTAPRAALGDATNAIRDGAVTVSNNVVAGPDSLVLADSLSFPAGATDFTKAITRSTNGKTYTGSVDLRASSNCTIKGWIVWNAFGNQSHVDFNVTTTWQTFTITASAANTGTAPVQFGLDNQVASGADGLAKIIYADNWYLGVTT